VSRRPLVVGRRALAEDAGQVIVLFAVSLPLFLALLLLAIDGGRLLVERARLTGAAQLAAEAAVSLAADGRGMVAAPAGVGGAAAGIGGAGAPAVPTAAQVRDMAKDAVLRNLPERGVSVSASIVSRPGGEPFTVRVRVEKEFVSSIQRIVFTIAGEASAQLGQSASAVAPSPSASPGASRTCYRVTIGWNYRGPGRFSQGEPDARARSRLGPLTANFDGGATDVIWAAPGTRHTFAATFSQFRYANYVSGAFTLPAGRPGDRWDGSPSFFSTLEVGVWPVAVPTQSANCR